MIGKVLGDRYELQEKIGEGGMAVVYKARCNKLNRFVAVKILKNEFSDNKDIVEKFTREATAIAGLSHPNIVNVLDVGMQDGLNYIVMEFVDGKTLKDVIRECGRLSFDNTISVSIQIAKALECAHKNSIIHRDVKPQNIMVTNDGMVKVTDFGIAKSASSATITNTTTIMGSAHYFSPEQAKGSVVDARTDLYSFGVVLYEMATGKLPFEADSPVSIALKHIQEEVVAPKKINSKVPDSLNNLILCLMQKEPSRRYQSAKEVLLDLEKIKADPNVFINSGTVDDENEHTIIMSPVKDDATMTNMAPVNSEDYDDEDYDDDDEYYDDEDDEDDDKKSSKNGKKKKINKKLIIILVAVFLALGVAAVAAATLLSGGSLIEPNKKDVVVPNISGMTIDEAEEALKDVGLELVDRGSEKSDKPKGTIIGVDPKEGTTVKEGSKVNIITSDGSDKVTMKNFAGSELKDATDFLDKNNLKYQVTKQSSDEIEDGLVIKTDPGEGTEISSDNIVTIYVSTGPETKSYTVPSVVGLSVDDAKSKLSKFDVNIVEKEVDSGSVGKVISQTNAGKKLEQGATVTITVGIEKKVQPKNIGSIISVGMTGSAAKSALEGAGYTVYIQGSADGKVVSWTPSSAQSGETVTVVTEEQKKQDANTTNNNNSNNNSNNNTNQSSNPGDKK